MATAAFPVAHGVLPGGVHLVLALGGIANLSVAVIANQQGASRIATYFRPDRPPIFTAARTTAMRIRRLGWSGIEIERGDDTLLIDYILDTSELPLRDDRQPFPHASEPASAVAGVLTHLHADHADPLALAVALRDGAPVFRPEPVSGSGFDLELTANAEAAFDKVALDARVIDAWTSREAGPFMLHAVPAVDGFGDPQLSWIVECDGTRIIHAGDTLFHSYWWRIARWFGSIDHAFLPINGAVVEFPFLQPPRDQEAVMTPEEAVKAACMLGARVVTPIHYGALHRPPGYIETDDPVGRLRAAGGARSLKIMVCEPGEWTELGQT